MDRSQQIEGMLALITDAERQELFAVMQSMQVVREAPADRIPVTLLVAGKTSAQADRHEGSSDPTKSTDYIEWAQSVRQQRYSEFIATVGGGEMKLLRDAGHNMQMDRPDAIVDAVMRYLAPVAAKR